MRPATFIFLIAVGAQWLVPLAGVWEQEQILAQGTIVRIRCAAPDPYDPLRGRFLAVRPEPTEFPRPAGMHGGKTTTVWATFKTDDQGLSTIASLSLEPVSGKTVIKLAARLPRWKSDDENVRLEWPVDRFYLNEGFAAEADRRMAELFRDGKQPVAVLRVRDGRAVLEDLLLDGISVRQVISQPLE